MSKPTVGAKSGSLPPAPTRLRQIALVARDLDRVREVLTYVLGTEVIYEDPGVAQFGLRNFLVPLGGEIVEVVSPIRPNTTAGRLLEKRNGDGGYMLIMQTNDARARKAYIESSGLGKTIWGYDHGDTVCVQYHPKTVPGGVIPELDSHAPTPSNPTPLTTRFSPWHACGPDPTSYIPAMQRASHLSLEGCVLRPAPGDLGHEDAARKWEEVFGVGRSRDLLAFTNARVGFVKGEVGKSEGIVSVTVGVRGREELEGILRRAGEKGLVREEDGEVWVCGVRWCFVLSGFGEGVKGKL